MGNSYTDPETGATLTSNGSAAGDACLETFARVGREMAMEKADAHAKLRAQGVAAIGADDGWVDRKENSWMPPSYATIFQPIKVGDKIALGWPWSGFRIVRVTAILSNFMGSERYAFEALPPE